MTLKEEENNELAQEEKLLLIEIIENHMRKIYQEIRQNELVINNEPLRCQYSEGYIVLLRTNNIDYRDRIKRLKILINKVSKQEIYKEDDLK
jgi:hypothetical protein